MFLTMKRILVLTLFMSAFLPVADAQILNPYKRALNRAEKAAGDALRNGADFVLDPIETVPVRKTSRNVSSSAQTNWGVQLLLPASLRQRLVDECTYKVVVKIADTGHPDHNALKQGQLPAKNYTTDPDASDGNGHSTHVCGIIAGDEIGLCDALVDKGLLKHKAVKILSNAGSGSFNWVQNAIASERAEDVAALQRGEFVVYNGSFGGGTGLIAGVETELQKSVEAGVVFCFAAGNTSGAGVNYPGNGKYSIACGSLDQSLARSSYSTTGPEVWNAMPGRNINSTYKGQTYATLSGTSMATPFLTAALAVAYSKWGPKLKGIDRVRAYLAWCAKDIVPIGKDNETGWGYALISNILDRDPSQTPGLPNDPPPPPPPGNSLVGVTPLTVALAKEYAINYDNLTQAASDTGSATTFKTAGKGSRKKNQGLALKTVKVRFVLTFPNKVGATEAATKLEAAVDKYFTNRGFLLPAKQDESWAAYWAAYFLEMGLSTGEKWEVDVLSVEHQSGGQKIINTNLLRWPRT